MRAHRFFLTDTPLTHSLWVHDERLLHQWRRVFRFTVGQAVILFNDQHIERLYTVVEIATDGYKLELVTDIEPQLPRRQVTLFWSLLKHDHNELVIEKATELGVSHFRPLVTERCVKTGFNLERAQKIAIEASEQSGRSSVPTIAEPIDLSQAIGTYASAMTLLVAQQGNTALSKELPNVVGILIGPEGGWSPAERELFAEHQFAEIGLGQFVLRAETAAIVAAAVVA